MKILIYDRDLFSSGVRYPVKEVFEKLGHSVDMFDWQYYLKSHTKPSFLNKVQDRLLKNHIDRINHDLQYVLKNGNYDVLFVVMGKYLYPETIKLAKTKVKYVVNWNTDDPLNTINSTRWLIESLPIYHAHFTPRIHLKEDYEKLGVEQLFELDWYYRYGMKSYDQYDDNHLYDGTFIGSWSKRRAEFVKPLVNDEIHIFGWGWNKKNNHSKINPNYLHPLVSVTEMMEVFSRSKINVNLLTIENNDTTNLRNFEIPAAHGFQLAEKSDKLLELFEENKEIVFFSSVDELVSKYSFYLKNDKERVKIANAGYKRVMEGGNSLVDRIGQIIHQIESLEV